ncbi:MAG: ribose 5-phosphate isomerase A, partial [Planctomycetota bacterium]
MTEQQTVDALAEAAVAEIQSGMTVGLGTGRTAARGVAALGERVKAEQLDIACVCTSHATESLARFHGLPVRDFAMCESVDFLFDGADEVDPQLGMLKGYGGAMARERMVAWASERCVYMVDESKVVDRLCTNKTLPIAVMAFGVASIRAGLRELGLHSVVRRTMQGQLFLTDNGNLIVDVKPEDDTDL